MKLETIEGEDSNTYQGLANATKAGMYETPHDALNRIPKRAITRLNQSEQDARGGSNEREAEQTGNHLMAIDEHSNRTSSTHTKKQNRTLSPRLHPTRNLPPNPKIGALLVAASRDRNILDPRRPKIPTTSTRRARRDRSVATNHHRTQPTTRTTTPHHGSTRSQTTTGIVNLRKQTTEASDGCQTRAGNKAERAREGQRSKEQTEWRGESPPAPAAFRTRGG
ncbi:BnaA02g23820D [Brassica napus]|uniref:(rape) hypothetical protein n=1 Tax=Brassica napus TaxID=3708 RepID=A0A078GNZ6_BRANA|nr:unnamed protein product [Brassica napus]CDY26388.1 BnaA02g23820D [Brassica napus]